MPGRNRKHDARMKSHRSRRPQLGDPAASVGPARPAHPGRLRHQGLHPTQADDLYELVTERGPAGHLHRQPPGLGLVHAVSQPGRGRVDPGPDRELRPPRPHGRPLVPAQQAPGLGQGSTDVSGPPARRRVAITPSSAAPAGSVVRRSTARRRAARHAQAVPGAVRSASRSTRRTRRRPAGPLLGGHASPRDQQRRRRPGPRALQRHGPLRRAAGALTAGCPAGRRRHRVDIGFTPSEGIP